MEFNSSHAQWEEFGSHTPPPNVHVSQQPGIARTEAESNFSLYLRIHLLYTIPSLQQTVSHIIPTTSCRTLLWRILESLWGLHVKLAMSWMELRRLHVCQEHGVRTYHHVPKVWILYSSSDSLRKLFEASLINNVLCITRAAKSEWVWLNSVVG